MFFAWKSWPSASIVSLFAQAYALLLGLCSWPQLVTPWFLSAKHVGKQQRSMVEIVKSRHLAVHFDKGPWMFGTSCCKFCVHCHCSQPKLQMSPWCLLAQWCLDQPIVPPSCWIGSICFVGWFAYMFACIHMDGCKHVLITVDTFNMNVYTCIIIRICIVSRFTCACPIYYYID